MPIATANTVTITNSSPPAEPEPTAFGVCHGKNFLSPTNSHFPSLKRTLSARSPFNILLIAIGFRKLPSCRRKPRLSSFMVIGPAQYSALSDSIRSFAKFPRQRSPVFSPGRIVGFAHPRIVIWLDQSSKFLIDACHWLKSQEDERAQLRRWIILIFAGWVPHDMDPSGAASV